MKRICAVIVAIILLAGVLFAREVVDTKAKEIMNKMTIAQKNNDLSDVNSYSKETEDFYYGEKGEKTSVTVFKEYKKGNKIRLSYFDYDPLKRELQHDLEVVTNGTNTWIFSSLYGKKKSEPDKVYSAMNSIESKKSPDLSFSEEKPETKKADSTEPESYVDYAGIEQINGISCHVIDMGEIYEKKKTSKGKMWISSDHYDLVKFNTDFAGMGALNSDFKTIKGKRFPFSSTVFMKSVKFTEGTIKSIRINEPIDNTFFDINAIKVSSGTGKPGFAASMFLLPYIMKDVVKEGIKDGIVGSIKQPAVLTGESKDEPQEADLKKVIKKEAGKKILKGLFGAVLP